MAIDQFTCLTWAVQMIRNTTGPGEAKPGLLITIGMLMILTLNTCEASSHCGLWDEPLDPRLNGWSLCGDAPTQRRLGELCSQVQWLCQSLTERPENRADLPSRSARVEEPLWVQRYGEGFAFGDWSDTQSWMAFWYPSFDQPSQVRLLLSRLKARQARNADDKHRNFRE
jgi:hypothetical protein